jgi:hypothetical protein
MATLVFSSALYRFLGDSIFYGTVILTLITRYLLWGSAGRTLRHMSIDIGGQSIWANNQPLKEVKRLLEGCEAFPTPNFLPTFTAHGCQ